MDFYRENNKRVCSFNRVLRVVSSHRDNSIMHLATCKQCQQIYYLTCSLQHKNCRFLYTKKKTPQKNSELDMSKNQITKNQNCWFFYQQQTVNSQHCKSWKVVKVERKKKCYWKYCLCLSNSHRQQIKLPPTRCHYPLNNLPYLCEHQCNTLHFIHI